MQPVKKTKNYLRAYCLAALDKEIRQVTTTDQGSRNTRLHRAAFSLAQLIADGGLDAEEIESHLIAAAMLNGLKEREALATIRSGIKGGQQHPRSPKNHNASARLKLSNKPRKNLSAQKIKPLISEQKSTYPPINEVSYFWNLCAPVTVDAEIAHWLNQKRCLEPQTIADADLARVLPSSTQQLPKWAGFRSGRLWSATDYRLVIPLFDDIGQMRSVVARHVPDPPQDGPPKSLGVLGFERRGLVMANGLAQQVLQLGTTPQWWNNDIPLRVVITEGEIDYLAWSIEKYAPDQTPAVIGVVQGSWKDDHALRIPDGAVVTIATDLDYEGNKYAESIVATFASRMRNGRLQVKRWKAQKTLVM